MSVAAMSWLASIPSFKTSSRPSIRISTAMARSAYTLQVRETAFQQDLNLDGQIGLKTTTLEAFGTTRLEQVANQYFLRDAAGKGFTLKYQRAALVVGQVDPWRPIAAEQSTG